MKASRFADEKTSEMAGLAQPPSEPRAIPLEDTPLENFKHLCAAVVYDAIRGIADGREDEQFQRAWVLGETESRMSFEMCVELMAAGTSFEQWDGLVEELRQRIVGTPRAMSDAFASHLQSMALQGVPKPRATSEASSSEADLAALLGEAPQMRRRVAPRPGRVC